MGANGPTRFSGSFKAVTRVRIPYGAPNPAESTISDARPPQTTTAEIRYRRRDGFGWLSAFASAHGCGQGVDCKPARLTRSFILCAQVRSARLRGRSATSAYPIPCPQIFDRHSQARSLVLAAQETRWKIGCNRVLLGMESDMKGPEA